MNRIPQGIKKKTNPEEVISKKLSRDPCGIGTCVIGLFLELIQYGRIHPIMITKDDIPNPTIRLNNLRKLLKKTLNVISFMEETCSLDTSIMTIPINGKIKNTIPKMGVTWCEVTVTAINDKDVNR